MFSTIRWCQYTSAAALLGLACSSSSSTPSKTADSAQDPTLSTSSAGAGEGAGASSTDPGDMQGSSATSSSTPSSMAIESGGPAARSLGTGASGDNASERVPVAGQDEAPQLDDSRIVAITDAANKAEIEQGRLARVRAKDPRVRDYAAMMVEHHSEAQRNQQKLKVQAQPSADVLNMQREATTRLDSLREKKAGEFDRAYIELQIEQQRRLLDRINRELVPAAQDKTVVSYLEELRTRVESHLAQAQRLQQELDNPTRPGGRSDASEPDDSSRTTITNQPGSAPRSSVPE